MPAVQPSTNLMVDAPNPHLPKPSTSTSTTDNKKRKRAANNNNKNRKAKKNKQEIPLSLQDFTKKDDLTRKDQEELDLEELVFAGDDFEQVGLILSEKVGKEGMKKVESKMDEEKEDNQTVIKGNDNINDDDDEEEEFSLESLGIVIDTKKSNIDVDSLLSSSSTAIKSTGESQHQQENEKEENEETNTVVLKSAWVDPDDTDYKINISQHSRLRKLRSKDSETTITGKDYELRLRAHFERLHPKPTWASTASERVAEKQASMTDGEEWNLFKSTHGIVSSHKERLLPDQLDAIRYKDANQMAYSQCVIQSMSWHPNGQVMATGGFDKTLRLFQVDGKINPKIQSVHFDDLPIHKSLFTPSGSELIITGRRKFFYVYNVETGAIDKIQGLKGRDTEKSFENVYMSPHANGNQTLPLFSVVGRDGYIHQMSRHNKQLLFSLKMNGHVSSVSYSRSNENILYSIGGEGHAEVYEWDLRMRSCVSKWRDEGALKCTALDVSGDGQWIATGQKSGVVNIYQTSDLPSSNTSSNSSLFNTHITTAKPYKTIMNLTTSINNLVFNATSEILAISSRTKKDSLKLVHLPTGKVFQNWPTSGTPLSFVNEVAFSPNGGYLSIGNDKGKVLLYRLGHYERA